LNNFGNALAEADRGDEALTVTAETVEIADDWQREIQLFTGPIGPVAVQPRGTARRSWAARGSGAAAEEAVEIRRQLAG